MYAKIKISGILEVVTGLHIGASGAFSAIGAVDSPVIRDALERDKPLIPGSSLKGKMRTLLARQYNTVIARSPEDDDVKILRLFGSANKKEYRKARLIFSDMVLENSDELLKRVDSLTEVKFENTINRLTAEANPRQIERVIRSSLFGLDIIYEITGQETAEIIEDFGLIRDGFTLLQYDYLGGSGSRGYGKIKFSSFSVSVVAGNIEKELIDKISSVISDTAG